jgi:putative membrane protein
MMDGGGWGWMAGGLMMLILWGGLAALIVFLVRGFGSRPPREDEKHRPGPQEIMAERFARGEISKDEFEERNRVLERQGTLVGNRRSAPLRSGNRVPLGGDGE